MDKSKKDKLNQIASNPVLVFLSYILTAVGFFLSLSDNIMLQIISISIMAIFLLVIIIALIKYRFNVKKEKDRLEKELTEKYEKSYFDSNEKNISFVSNIIRSVVDNSLNTKNASITDEHFHSICENLCKLIGTLLHKLCDIEFSVCIKQICVEEVLTYKYSDASTRTIARSGNRTTEREKNDFTNQPISDNTSFLTILKTNDRCWASCNLNDTKKIMEKSGNEYKNPDKDYKKYYSSTIVVPIRINSKYISNTILEYSATVKPKGFHYIAFLCIDSPQTFSPKDKNFHLASAVLSSCGDALYPLFENKLVKEIDKVE